MFEDPQVLSVLLTGFALIVCFGFFTLCQVALLRASKRAVEAIAVPWSSISASLLDDVAPCVVSCQVAKVLVGLSFGSAVIPGAHHLIHSLIWSGTAHATIASDAAAWLLAFFFGSVGMLFVHQFARSFGALHPDGLLVAVTIPLRLSCLCIYPLVSAVNAVVEFVLRLGGASAIPAASEHIVSAERLSDIVEQSGDAGEISNSEREMIQGVFEISDTPISRVMTPRGDVITVRDDASLDALRDIFSKHKLSRVLVVGTTLDEVHGVIVARDLLPFVGDSSREFRIKELIRPVKFVPNSVTVKKLFHDFQLRGVHFAVVHDEHGGVDGIVTFEDLLEEIVGEIYDEYDIPAEETSVQPIGDQEYHVGGSLALEALRSKCGFELPEGEYETVAGFLMRHFGKIPAVGEDVTVNGIYLKVLMRTQYRISKVLVRRVAPADEALILEGHERSLA